MSLVAFVAQRGDDRAMRWLFGLVVGACAVAAVSIASGQTITQKPCAIVNGPPWTQTINLSGYLPPPKEPELRVIHGSRYNVFTYHVRCAWAMQQMTVVDSRGRGRQQNSACRAVPPRLRRDSEHELFLRLGAESVARLRADAEGSRP